MTPTLPPGVPGFTIPATGPVKMTAPPPEAPSWTPLAPDSPFAKTAGVIRIGIKYHVIFDGALQWAPHYADPVDAARALVDVIKGRVDAIKRGE